MTGSAARRDESEGSRVCRLARFGLTTGNPSRLAEFYENAFGSRSAGCERRAGASFERQMGVRGGANCLTITLGEASIELLEFDTPGQPYPADVSPYDTRFQHFAFVVTDMRLALERLRTAGGWTAISAGPQRLPERSGGVTAFKFRDPDGHPLELLEFPRDQVPAHWQRRLPGRVVLGIDHSAMSVADVGRSVAFYEGLGLGIRGRTFNSGIEQEQLDGIHQPRVDVLALAPSHPTPHVELLCYDTSSRPCHDALRVNDVAASRLIFLEGPGSSPKPGSSYARAMQDPDGHYIQVVLHRTQANRLTN